MLHTPLTLCRIKMYVLHVQVNFISPRLTHVYTTPIISEVKPNRTDWSHLFNHPFDLPLLAEHHVVQVFDPLTEICRFRPQLLGPEDRNGSHVSPKVRWRRTGGKKSRCIPQKRTQPGEFPVWAGDDFKNEPLLLKQLQTTFFYHQKCEYAQNKALYPGETTHNPSVHPEQLLKTTFARGKTKT